VAGCGGGSDDNGDGETGMITVNIKGADWAAYQASPWQVIDLNALDNDTFTFEADSSGKYGIAVHCPENDKEINIYHATYSKMPEVDASCKDENMSRIYSVSGTVVGATYERTLITMSTASAYLFGSLEYNLSVTEGTYDLLGVEVNAAKIPQKITIKRDISVNGDQAGQDLDFGNGYGVVAYGFNIVGGMGMPVFVSKNGSILTPDIPGSSSWHALAGGTMQGDYYNFFAVSNSDREILIHAESALSNLGNVTLNVGAIRPFNGVTAKGIQTVYNGLRYVPAVNSPKMIMYMISQGQSVADGEVEREVWLSKEWLGTTTTYTLPDLSNLTGWNSSWNFQTGSAVEWEVMAVMANKSIREVTGNMIDRENAPPVFMVEGLEMGIASAEEGTFTP